MATAVAVRTGSRRSRSARSSSGTTAGREGAPGAVGLTGSCTRTASEIAVSTRFSVVFDLTWGAVATAATARAPIAERAKRAVGATAARARLSTTTTASAGACFSVELAGHASAFATACVATPTAVGLTRLHQRSARPAGSAATRFARGALAARACAIVGPTTVSAHLTLHAASLTRDHARRVARVAVAFGRCTALFPDSVFAAFDTCTAGARARTFGDATQRGFVVVAIDFSGHAVAVHIDAGLHAASAHADHGRFAGRIADIGVIDTAAIGSHRVGVAAVGTRGNEAEKNQESPTTHGVPNLSTPV